MSKLSTPSMTSTFTSSSTSTFSPTSTFSSRPTSSPTSTSTSTPTYTFSSSSATTFSPTSSYLPIEVYDNKTVLPKPTFQPVYNIPSSPNILEIAIIITLISSFIMCIICHVSLSKSKRRLREEAVARQELRLREEAVTRAIIQQNPLYQV